MKLSLKWRELSTPGEPGCLLSMHQALPVFLQGLHHSLGPAAAQAEAVINFVQSTSLVGRMCRFLEDCSQSHSELKQLQLLLI